MASTALVTAVRGPQASPGLHGEMDQLGDELVSTEFMQAIMEGGEEDFDMPEISQEFSHDQEGSTSVERTLGLGTMLGVPDPSRTCTWDGCGKTFASKWALERHYRIHTGEKPWKCEEEGCGKAFIDRALLKRHLLTHSNQRPFVCPHSDCDKAFKVQKHLEYHLKLHEQSDAFACHMPGCGKCFANPSSLRIHKLIEHESTTGDSFVEKRLRERLDASWKMAARQREKLAALEKRNAELTAENRELKKLNKALVPQLESLKGRNVQLVKEVQNLKEGNSNMGSLLGADSMGKKRVRSAAVGGVSQTTSYVGSELVGDGGRPPSPTGSSRPRGQTLSNAVSQRAVTSSPKKRRALPPPLSGGAAPASLSTGLGTGGAGLGGMGQHMSQLAAAMCNPFALPNPYSNPLFGPSPFAHPGALGLGAAGVAGSQPGAEGAGIKGELGERAAQGKAQAQAQQEQAQAHQGQHAAHAQKQASQQQHAQQQQQQQQTLFAAQMAQMAQMAHYAHLQQQQQQQQQQQSQQAGISARGGGSSAQLWPGLLPPAALFAQPSWHQQQPLAAEPPSNLAAETQEQREARQAREGARDGALAVSQVFAAQRAALLAKRAAWNSGGGVGGLAGLEGFFPPGAKPAAALPPPPQQQPQQPAEFEVPLSQSREAEAPLQAEWLDAAANRLNGDRVAELIQNYELDDNAGA